MLAYRPAQGSHHEGEAGSGNALALDVEAIAPAGHSIAVRVRMTYPAEVVERWPETWVSLYQSEALMLRDPVFRWVCTGMASSAIRWRDLAGGDEAGVLQRAADHGLRHGAAVTVIGGGPGGHRSWGIFARADREFTDGEIARLAAHVEARHRHLVAPRNITTAEIDALRLLKAGQRLKQIAWTLGVTEGAVKQRLKSARGKLEVRTGAEAISRASSLRLI